ncbi:geranylgeranyl reductase family protein [Methanocaldococcus fervens]|uniref:Geranylgeranyl reductase n=1 Tax=Methanocaldococcus fervens (strain DSM 4213 / JCM 15782 / AG86) TaxID=573064 RepID=C7P775_METFA|nr:geranylgeranyl reductase family protein [Methanocaldococcus fervens]ACV24407.1 geranylgeranyl reductase [Methanocaldococcus fervens AG86]
MDDYDVVIIGGGPVGCITGENIKNGRVLIVEEHQSIGVPLQCAGLISKNGAKELGNPKGVVNKVRGAYICSKSNMVKIGNEEIRAYVFERKVMDKDIAIRAGKKCDFLLKAYGEIEKDKKGYKVKISHLGEKIYLNPEVVVGADGSKTITGKKLGLVNNKNREILSSCQFEMVNADCDDDFVYVFLDKRYSERFFTWIIPMGDDRVRVGLLDRGNCYNKLMKFINENETAKEILKNATITEFSSGSLPIGYLERSVKDNVLLVGDAACHVKPLSGGGLYFGAVGGKIAGEIISRYLNGEIDNLELYDKKWKEEFGNEIKNSLIIRKLFLKLKNDTLDEIIGKLKTKSELIDYINKYGDMDRQASLIIKVLKIFRFWMGFKILKDLL